MDKKDVKLLFSRQFYTQILLFAIKIPRHSFRLFAERIPEEGLLIISSNIENYEEITAGLPCRVQMVGTRAEDDYRMDHITYNASGKPEFDCYV